MKTNNRCYDRIVLKLSGEALIGKQEIGINTNIVSTIANDIRNVVNIGTKIAIVVGGGNFFRGANICEDGISRIAGDHMGMIATMLNAVAMEDIFNQLKINTKVMSAVPIDGLLERYDYRKANEYLDNNIVLILAGGTGNPLVTTDTALCLRGIELGADLILKATNVDGVYEDDPKKNPLAQFYKVLTYDQALKQQLAVMDLSAFCLGRDQKMKLRVFNIKKRGALLNIIHGFDEGTLIESV